MSWSWLGSDDEDETVEIGDDATSAVLIWFIIMPQCTMHFYMHFLLDNEVQLSRFRDRMAVVMA